MHAVSPRRTRRAVACAVALVSAPALVLALGACGHQGRDAHPYGAIEAAVGDSQALLGWDVSVANLRFADDHLMFDVDGPATAPADPPVPRAAAGDLRFGLYGSLAHPVEATGLGSCQQVPAAGGAPATSTPDRISGTVCLGPVSDQAQVRGVYLYSPRDRIPGTTVAYPAAFPVGLPPIASADTGLTVSTESVEAWRADGAQLTAASLGDPSAFTGKGYMLLGLRAAAVAEEYRDGSSRRGGPMMLLAAPTLSPPGLSPACSAYGASVLVLPEASLDAVQVAASLCTQGDINAALLYATVSVVGTHAAVWTRTDRP